MGGGLSLPRTPNAGTSERWERPDLVVVWPRAGCLATCISPEGLLRLAAGVSPLTAPAVIS